MARKRQSILPELTWEEKTVTLPQVVGILSKTHKESPITSKQICESLGIKNNRFMKIINKLRRDASLPICSGPAGYWLARSSEELKDSADSLQDRQQVIREAELGLRRMYADFKLQGL